MVNLRPAWIRRALLRLPTLALCLAASSVQAEVPQAVRDHLARGVTISYWFAGRDDAGIDPNIWRPDADDLSALHRIGLRHVRIPVDRSWIALAKDPGHPDGTHLSELLSAVQAANDEDLLAVITLNATGDYINRLAGDASTQQTACDLWWNIARQLSERVGPDHLAFEVLNEPGIDGADSSRLMQILAGAIRNAAPAHTLIVAGGHYSKVEDLVELKPLADSNVVYTFHFYEPQNFTHQGATWGWAPWAKFHDFPYPSSPALVAPILDLLDPEARPHAEYYGEQRWNRDKLATFLDKASEWARSNHQVIWCGEFGALKASASRSARDNWLRDVRELLEQRGIGWAHFDFAEHFGLVDGPQKSRKWDRGALDALGLQPP